MPLNYSKWDQLELSDDSDIEGHPNVDKKSLIRWKQRDIHEKRELRKHQITAYKAEIDCNDVIRPRIEALISTVTPASFSSLVDQLQTSPSPDMPPTNAPGQPTYDSMVLSLLQQVSQGAKERMEERGDKTDQEKLGEYLKEGLEGHLKGLTEHQEKLKQKLVIEEAEQRKHITSDDIHDGFDSKYVPPPPAPVALPTIKFEKPKKKTTTTEIEVLNPGASTSSPAEPETESDDDDELPQLTPSLEEFSRIGLHQYEKSWEFIQAHRDVVVPGASDALLVAAFGAQGEGKSSYAKRCVHQSLLLQYCDKLGGDGVRVFFRKMIQGDKRATTVFVKDVEDTYTHLVTRVAAGALESQGQEQIQLVPENEDTTISFNVPEGPPPENLTLEGPGTEGLDIEEVRKALQFRWDVFQGFSPEMQEALKDGGLDAVNKVLGDIGVERAEEIVGLLDQTGILNFAESEIRDETGNKDA